MKLFTFLLPLVLLIANASSQSNQQLMPQPENPSVINTIAQLIVDYLSRAIQYFFEFIDIKVRTVRFLTSLYTTDNLQLVRRFLNIGLRFGNWIYELIPTSTTDGTNMFLSFLFPQVDQKYDEDEEYVDPSHPIYPVEDKDESNQEEDEDGTDNGGDYMQNFENFNSLHDLIYARRKK